MKIVYVKEVVLNMQYLSPGLGVESYILDHRSGTG